MHWYVLNEQVVWQGWAWAGAGSGV